MKTIRIAEQFCDRLVNRNEYQGDGKYHAEMFRKRFLAELDLESAWETLDTVIELDFSGVRKIGPSFANEALAYFIKYTTPENFKKKVKLSNLTKVKDIIINRELNEATKIK